MLFVCIHLLINILSVNLCGLRVLGEARRSCTSATTSGWREDTTYVVEHGPLLGDEPGGEMCLNLSKPDIWVSGPEWGKLNAHRSDIRAKGVVFHQGWAIFFDS